MFKNLSNDTKVPVWLDCDPGNDDAMAIILSLADQRCNLLGISTTFGNVHIKATTLNAIKILSSFGRADIPVIQGASKALKKTKHTDAGFVHGESGMFGADQLEAHFDPIIDDSEGVDSLNSHLTKIHFQRQEKIHLIITGPTTNIARLFQKYPDSINLIEQLVIMGGSIQTGNITPYAEFNVYTDPEALQIVLNHTQSVNLKVVLVPLDLTHKATVQPEYIQKIKSINTKLGRWSGSLLEQYRQAEINHGLQCSLHDAITLNYCLYENEYNIMRMHIRVNLDNNSDRYGQTEIIEDQDPNVHFTIDSNQSLFWNRLEQVLGQSKHQFTIFNV